MVTDVSPAQSAAVNRKLADWIAGCAGLCQPDCIVWCDGSKAEYARLMGLMTSSGMAVPLKKRPGSFLFRSDPSDVARLEDRTYISYSDKNEAGPTNIWMDPVELKEKMAALYLGSMRGRTMYVIPFSMGPVGSTLARTGIEVTDSPYVVCNMHIMTRVGDAILDALGPEGDFVPCLHSVGEPLRPGQKDSLWPCAPIERKFISHFPDENLIWSFGSGYGGNALLGKKCMSLRIASVIARREGWMAEHMLIMRLTDPDGRRFHIAGAFPSACGKTNLAMMVPTIPGWKAECLGDDIAWMEIRPDGRLYAINPETGFFGVAPGTSAASNPMAAEMVREKAIFTNCALTDDGDVWWEGMSAPPAHAVDWKGRDWTPAASEPAAHPNARFTVSASQCPVISPDWEDPAGVPIDIIIFGGRRSSLVPLVCEALNWDHGVYMGASAASETTAAVIGTVGSLRRDPFAMLPFCGYNMADYFAHWFKMGDRLGSKAPRIFYANWFRKDEAGRFIWPGFGENARVLKWMCDRVAGRAEGIVTPIGILPREDELSTAGLDIRADDLKELLRVDRKAWCAEAADAEAFFARFGHRLPARLKAQLIGLKERLC